MKAETIKIKLGGKGNSFATVDAQDSWLLLYHWHVSSCAYVQGLIGQDQVKLHRAILGDSCTGLQVDHVNGNLLDNRRCNLRVVTRSQNGQNRQVLNSNNTTGWRGVSHAGNGRYQAYARLDGKLYFAGRHGTPEAAGNSAARLRRMLGFLTSEPVRTND